MPSTSLSTEPELDKPEAGLPLVELAVAKYIMFPMLRNLTSKEKAIDVFAEETERIIALIAELKPDLLTERRLIPRLKGLEDSSRYWSVAMTIEHLVIVGGGIAQVIVDLSKNGGSKRPPRGTADVKPNPDVDAQKIINKFKQMSDAFIAEMKPLNVGAFPSATFLHPWFGQLNAHSWLTLAGMHQRIHRKQIEKIISLL